MDVAVPERLSLLAWDDSALCRLSHPALSAMSLDVHAMGVQVADCVLNLLASGHGPLVHGTPAPARGPRHHDHRTAPTTPDSRQLRRRSPGATILRRTPPGGWVGA